MVENEGCTKSDGFRSHTGKYEVPLPARASFWYSPFFALKEELPG